MASSGNWFKWARMKWAVGGLVLKVAAAVLLVPFLFGDLLLEGVVDLPAWTQEVDHSDAPGPKYVVLRSFEVEALVRREQLSAGTVGDSVDFKERKRIHYDRLKNDLLAALSSEPSTVLEDHRDLPVMKVDFLSEDGLVIAQEHGLVRGIHEASATSPALAKGGPIGEPFPHVAAMHDSGEPHVVVDAGDDGL